jgi:hypothetical protein
MFSALSRFERRSDTFSCTPLTCIFRSVFQNATKESSLGPVRSVGRLVRHPIATCEYMFVFECWSASCALFLCLY